MAVIVIAVISSSLPNPKQMILLTKQPLRGGYHGAVVFYQHRLAEWNNQIIVWYKKTTFGHTGGGTHADCLGDIGPFHGAA
jgi:hypothetical protein